MKLLYTFFIFMVLASCNSHSGEVTPIEDYNLMMKDIESFKNKLRGNPFAGEILSIIINERYEYDRYLMILAIFESDWPRKNRIQQHLKVEWLNSVEFGEFDYHESYGKVKEWMNSVDLKERPNKMIQ